MALARRLLSRRVSKDKDPAAYYATMSPVMLFSTEMPASGQSRRHAVRHTSHRPEFVLYARPPAVPRRLHVLITGADAG